ncbi:serine hydrolase domain-containing protein [Stigmatella aurantiaca]|uniref:Beta-lactamase n=1 Tax=Stigmatella aurantiaca (strain DW4/3-1) TaxID=378806 RepID=Q08XQ1_STIAD|nr:serine hydrolase domain-containing protein [Stigmatella aurantiaca]ADO75384.1 Beta-lactamase family protein [Stigmatella aurantiaca DW4/3-1]EAU65248.1 beta-lactamase [Stigmatella aurantiaca DW4/3-1]
MGTTAEKRQLQSLGILSRAGRAGLRKRALGAALILAMTGCGEWDEEGADAQRCAQRAPRLQARLEALAQEMDLPGVTASLRLRNCLWHGAAGEALVEPDTEMTAENRLRVGSITKTFVATVALQLQAEGRLSLDATLAQYLPGFPNAEVITVRQLLNHTSGVANYTTHPAFRAETNSHLGRTWTFDELIALGAAESPALPPGTGWNYANTNYLLVGFIIERVTGTSLAEQLRARIIEPLGLRSTGLDGDEVLSPVTVHGYERTTQASPWSDVTGVLHPSAAGAAGALVSSADDISLFYQSLFERPLLAAEQRAEMMEWIQTREPKVPEYGLALMRRTTPEGPGHGHSGSFPGYSADAAYFPDQKAALAILVNTESSNLSTMTQQLLEVLTAP